MTCAYDEAVRIVGDRARVTYAPGYAVDKANADPALIDAATALASSADVAVVFIGLTDAYESEGYDRTHLDLPPSHVALLEAVLAVQSRVAVVLSNGSPVAMPWWIACPPCWRGTWVGRREVPA